MSAVLLRDVKKTFQDRTIVSGINIAVDPGVCLGLLGPDGAGKSTILKMIYGSLGPSSGDIYVLGMSASKQMTEIKSKLGVIPQNSGLDEEFTVRENLELTCRYYEVQTSNLLVEEVLRNFRLLDVSHFLVSDLSGGMRQRLAIARATITDPDLYILDEPTVGLDIEMRNWIWSILLDIKAKRKTILISTHSMQEAEKICDQVAFVCQGHIVKLGSPSLLIEELVAKEVVEIELLGKDVDYFANKLKKSGFEILVSAESVTVFLNSMQSSKQVLEMAVGTKTTIRKPNLSDAYLRATGSLLFQ